MKRSCLFKFLAWEVVNPFLLRTKKRKKYTFPVSYHGINIGCGIDNPASYIGIDGGITHYLLTLMPRILIRSFFKRFNMSKNFDFETYYKKASSVRLIHHDVTFGLPFHNNSIPNIYSSHFFEHIRKEEAIELLKECHRVLLPEGRIRICVPSLQNCVREIETAIDEYRKGNPIPVQKYVTVEQTGYLPKYNFHQWMYDFRDLEEIMSGIGFTGIKECSFKIGEITDVGLLDTRPGIFIEAMK